MYLILVSVRPSTTSFIIGNWVTDQERNGRRINSFFHFLTIIGLFLTGIMTVSQLSTSLSSSFFRQPRWPPMNVLMVPHCQIESSFCHFFHSNFDTAAFWLERESVFVCVTDGLRLYSTFLFISGIAFIKLKGVAFRQVSNLLYY